jgi:hypothetical protein
MHPDIGPELRQLAQAILDRLDPIVRAAGALAASVADRPGKCQQVWCPVCALAALANGESHPLLGVVAEHGAALLPVLRAMVQAPPDGGPPDGGAPDDQPPTGPGRYQHIPVTVEE